MRIKRPVSEQFRISSPYGDRIDPITKAVTEHHNGIDFSCPVGAEVRAICDGRIGRVGWESDIDPHKGFGLRVWQTFRDDSGTKYGIVYGHLSKIDVEEGMEIKQGEVIGLSGNSGRSTGAHLHVGIRTWNSNDWIPIEV